MLVLNITKIIKKYQDFLWIGIIIGVSGLNLLYALRTSLYFSVDDFAVLAYVRNHSIIQIFINFLLNGDLFGFRKILGYEVFKILFDLFKVNPIPYILANHLLALLNLFLLFFIVKFLTKNSFTAFFVGIIFNKIYLFYFSNVHEYLALFFGLLTVYFFLKFPKKIYLSFITFILALLSKELSFSIPFLLLSLAYFMKTDKKKIIPFFIILSIYAVYQLSFFIKGASLPQNMSYQLSFGLGEIASAFVFYFSIPVILLIAALLIFQRKWNLLPFVLSVIITILPTLFLINRHEAYYIYIPFAYLMILISLLLPPISIKTSLLYLLIIFIFGGRSVFPTIARQNYPNWQKVSIDNVLKVIENSISENPKLNTISLKGINIERDAHLMLQSGTTDLFLPSEISSKYSFIYNEGQNLIEVKLKS